MPHGRIAELARGIAQLFFPNACLLCEAPELETAPLRHGFCSTCHQSLAADPATACPRCAATIGPHTDISDGCVACRDRSYAFRGVVRLGPYQGPLKDAILQIKHSAGEPVAEMLGRVFAEERITPLRGFGVEMVVSVPLHWRRRWSRGFNQAAVVAEEVAGELGAKFAPQVLRRVKPAPQHAQPSASARIENIRGAFACSPRASLAGRNILLVDDVMTTGSTAGEAARMLKASGAAAIFVAVLARA